MIQLSLQKGEKNSLIIVKCVCLCAQFRANPKECHVKTVKKITKYIKETYDYGLWYPRGTHFDLCAYMNSYYDGSRNNRKITTGYMLFSKKLSCFMILQKANFGCIPIAEAKHISSGLGCAQILWTQHILEDYDEHQGDNIVL